MYLLQRTKGPQGRGLGKTSGWVHRASLKAKGVQQLSGVNYERIDDDGLHISFGPDRERTQAARGRQRGDLRGPGVGARPRGRRCARSGIDPHVIGGAAVAAELDAKRAIQQGTELAARL